VLETVKANYGRGGGEISMRWREGLFINETPSTPGGLSRLAAEAKAERVFVDLLSKFHAQDRDVSPNRSNSFAPTVFAKHPEAEGINKRDFEGAMERLLSARRIDVETVGPPSRRYKRLIPANRETED
jgi:hypothetical protein